MVPRFDVRFVGADGGNRVRASYRKTVVGRPVVLGVGLSVRVLDLRGEHDGACFGVADEEQEWVVEGDARRDLDR
jgi:hypothetical protein